MVVLAGIGGACVKLPGESHQLFDRLVEDGAWFGPRQIDMGNPALTALGGGAKLSSIMDAPSLWAQTS